MARVSGFAKLIEKMMDKASEVPASDVEYIPDMYKHVQSNGNVIVDWDGVKEGMPFLMPENIQKLLTQDNKTPEKLLGTFKDNPLVSDALKQTISKITQLISNTILYPAKYDGQDLAVMFTPLVETMQKASLLLAKDKDGKYRDDLSAKYYLENADPKNPNTLSPQGKNNSRAIVKNIVSHVRNARGELQKGTYQREFMESSTDHANDLLNSGLVSKHGDLFKMDLSLFGIKDAYGLIPQDKLLTVVKDIQQQYGNLPNRVSANLETKIELFKNTLETVLDKQGMIYRSYMIMDGDSKNGAPNIRMMKNNGFYEDNIKLLNQYDKKKVFVGDVSVEEARLLASKRRDLKFKILKDNGQSALYVQEIINGKVIDSGIVKKIDSPTDRMKKLDWAPPP